MFLLTGAAEIHYFLLPKAFVPRRFYAGDGLPRQRSSGAKCAKAEPFWDSASWISFLLGAERGLPCTSLGRVMVILVVVVVVSGSFSLITQLLEQLQCLGFWEKTVGNSFSLPMVSRLQPLARTA